MTAPQPEPSGTDLADEFAAAVDWWKAAGVDYDYANDVTDWLAVTAAKDKGHAAPQMPGSKTKAPSAPERKIIGGPHENWPDALAEFQTWWVSSDAIDEGGAFPPIPPLGAENAKLMILVAEPEEDDRERLLSGPQGKLLRGMMRAAGLQDDQIYFASVLRRHTPMPDWAELQAAGLGDLLAHHITLAKPRMILAFGRSILPLIGNDTAQGAAHSSKFNHEGRSIPVLGAGSLPELLRSAPRRQRFWQRWLEWTDG